MFLIKKGFWQIKKTKDRGYGVFAKKAIEADIIIGDYLGKVINTAEYDLGKDKNGLYLMYLTDHASIYPNLKKPGIHLLNHSCLPNCWIYTYCGHTLFFTLRQIEPGEELTISYLLSPKSKNYGSCLHACRCDSKSCTGTMHLSEEKYKIWQKFQNREKKKTKTAKFVFGKNLPKLTSYPKTIPNNPIYLTIIKETQEDHTERLEALSGDMEQVLDKVEATHDEIGLWHQRDKREIDEIKKHLDLPLIPDVPQA